MGTSFTEVYNRFLGKITDDMYMELTPQDTIRDLRNLLIEAIPGFEFPRKDLSAYAIVTSTKSVSEVIETDFVISQDAQKATIEASAFIDELTSEEINILAILMMINWVQRQITSIENTRMKYSGSDFKFTSQANHLSKLLTLLTEVQRQSHHMQRLYKRRKHGESGAYESNWSVLGTISAID
jgi:hypothetical protein